LLLDHVLPDGHPTHVFFHIGNESMTALESPKHSLFAERHLLQAAVGTDGPAVDQGVVIRL
jgi:hypothetical protein